MPAARASMDSAVEVRRGIVRSKCVVRMSGSPLTAASAVTHDGKDYIVDRTLTEVGEKLPPNLFFRINRRFIVAFDAIREMIRYSGSRIKVVLHPPLAEGEEAFVSTDRVPDFRQWLNR